jgi:hypothetical protein
VARLDVADVDRLARLQLRARRIDCTVRLDHLCPGLEALLELCGLRVQMKR